MVPHSAPGAEGAPIDLLSKATSTLWDLSGISGMGKPGSYAAAAAISALATPATKCSAATPPTVKQKKQQIQNALSCYEQVSKELPGAPRTTLLNIIARSDLHATVHPPP